MLRNLLTLTIFANLALSWWYVDKTKAKHINKVLSNDEVIKAFITLNQAEENSAEQPVKVHSALLHILYSTPLFNKNVVTHGSNSWNKSSYLFKLALPNTAIISISTQIETEDLEKFVLPPKEPKEGEEAPEETPITPEQRIGFLQKLISKSSDTYFQYQENSIRGSFELEHGNEDDNCILVKYQMFTGTNFEHLPLVYCEIWKKVDDETRKKEVDKVLKKAKVVADPYKIIAIPGIPTETITKTYTEFKQVLDKKIEEANKEKEAEGDKDKDKEGEGDKDKDKEGEGDKEKEGDKDKEGEGDKDKDKDKEGDKDKDKDNDKDKEVEKVKWYKSGWFIALIVIFIVLVITGVVLAGLMVSNKDKTLDYTS